MSCIYKYKGKDYTKDEFYSLVRNLNFIQQEQQKKFAELQERLTNKEFLEGAKNAYESSKGLQEWGTQEQYNDYIARVSLGIVKNPSSGEYNYNSKVKDIVYHGTNLNFDKFDKAKIGSNTAVKGEKPSFSFSNNKQQAEAHSSEITVGQNTNELAEVWFEENQHIFKNGDMTTGIIDINNVFEHYKKELEYSKEMISPTKEIDPVTNRYKLVPVNDKNLKELSEIKTKEWQQEYNTLLTAGARVMTVILDIKNPKIIDFKGEKKSAKFKEEQLSTKGDAFIAKNIDDWGVGDVIQVFEPEQTHILGSQQDIEGFREYIQKGLDTIEGLQNQGNVIEVEENRNLSDYLLENEHFKSEQNPLTKENIDIIDQTQENEMHYADFPEERFEMWRNRDTFLQTGSVIRHLDNTYLVWNAEHDKGTKVQLKKIMPDGSIEPYSGTYNRTTIMDKVIGSFPVVETEMNSVIVLDDNNIISTTSGKQVWKGGDIQGQRAYEKAKHQLTDIGQVTPQNPEVRSEQRITDEDVSGGTDITQVPYYESIEQEGELTNPEDEVIEKTPDGFIRVGEMFVKPDNPVGAMVVNAITTGHNLWSKIFPYEDYFVNETINRILEETVSDTAGRAKRVQARQHVFREMKKFFVSSEQLGIFEGNPQYQRERLFIDKGEDNISIANYLQQVISSNTNFASILKQYRLLNMFQYDIQKNGDPSLIKFNNSSADSFNEELLYASFPSMIEDNLQLPDFNGNPYTTKELAKDLMAYAYLEGGVQEAVQFIKYIPVEYLNNISFAPIMREWHSRGEKGSFSDILGFKANGIGRFENQYMRHHPGRATKIVEGDILAPKYNGARRLENLESFHLHPEDERGSKNFISIYNPKLKGKKFQLYFRSGTGYTRVSVLGTFGLSEYSMHENYNLTIVNDYKKIFNPKKAIEPTQKENKSDVFGLLSNSFEGILDNIQMVDYPEYPHLNLLAGHLKKFARNSKVKVVVAPVVDVNNNRVGNGSFLNTPEGGVITIDTNYFNTASPEMLAKTFVHEAIHALTENYMSQYLNRDGTYKEGVTPPAEIQELVLLFNRTKEVLGKAVEDTSRKIQNRIGLTDFEKKVAYAGTSVYELVTLALTEPLFQKTMSDVTYEATNKSVFEKFADIINKIINAVLGTNYDRTKLTGAVIANTLRIIESQHKMDKSTQIDKMMETDAVVEKQISNIPKTNVSTSKVVMGVLDINQDKKFHYRSERPVKIEINGQIYTFNTYQAAMLGMKAKVFTLITEDVNKIFNQLLLSKTHAEAVNIGAKLTTSNEERWDTRKSGIFAKMIRNNFNNLYSQKELEELKGVTFKGSPKEYVDLLNEMLMKSNAHLEPISIDDVVNDIFQENSSLEEVATKEQFREFLRDNELGVYEVNNNAIESFKNEVDNSNNPLICD